MIVLLQTKEKQVIRNLKNIIGRDLITDDFVAVFELVKNSYDSNANEVSIEFVGINPITDESKIIIQDDGFGMDFSDIKNKWMVIFCSVLNYIFL